jgi:hypothetical protein
VTARERILVGLADLSEEQLLLVARLVAALSRRTRPTRNTPTP